MSHIINSVPCNPPATGEDQKGKEATCSQPPVTGNARIYQDVVAVYSLNHPTLPNVKVRVIQDAPCQFFIEEYRDGAHVRDHHFPFARTKRAILKEARALLVEAKHAH
mgnify:CR=1 FL=1